MFKGTCFTVSTPKATKFAPVGNYASSLHYSLKSLLLIGGETDFSISADWKTLNLDSRKWENLKINSPPSSSLFPLLSHHTCHSVENVVVVIGMDFNSKSKKREVRDCVHILFPMTNKIETHKSEKWCGIRKHCSVLMKKEGGGGEIVVVYGGEMEKKGKVEISEKLYLFEVKEWTMKLKEGAKVEVDDFIHLTLPQHSSSLPPPLLFPRMCEFEGDIFLFGGSFPQNKNQEETKQFQTNTNFFVLEFKNGKYKSRRRRIMFGQIKAYSLYAFSLIVSLSLFTLFWRRRLK